MPRHLDNVNFGGDDISQGNNDDAEVNGYITSTKSRFDVAMKNYNKKKR